jgi:hypothetical protein
VPGIGARVVAPGAGARGGCRLHWSALTALRRPAPTPSQDEQARRVATAAAAPGTELAHLRASVAELSAAHAALRRELAKCTQASASSAAEQERALRRTEQRAVDSACQLQAQLAALAEALRAERSARLEALDHPPGSRATLQLRHA